MKAMARGNFGGYTGESSAIKSRHAVDPGDEDCILFAGSIHVTVPKVEWVECSRLSINATRFSCRAANGGPGRDRTGDLIVANDALSQLSYRPMYIQKTSATHQTTYPFWH